MESTPSAAEIPLQAFPARSRGRFRFWGFVLWIGFILSAWLPVDAIWLGYGHSFSYEGSIGRDGIKWNFDGAPQTAFHLLSPFVNLAAGLLLAFWYLPKGTLWRPFRNGHLVLSLLLGEGLLLAAMFGLILPHHAPIHYAWFFAVSAVEGVWFHGLLMESQKKRPVFAVVLSSVLLGLWHEAFIFRPAGFGLDTDYGLQRAALIALAAIPFGIARCRDASVRSLILANFLLSLLSGASQTGFQLSVRLSFYGLLAVGVGYVCLNLFLILLPVPLRPLACMRYCYPLLPGALLLITGTPPFLNKLEQPSQMKSPKTRAERWAADFKVLATTYPGKHIDFEKRTSRRAFQERCDHLAAQAEKLSDRDLLLETRKLIADLHVDHSYVKHPWQGLYPVRFEWVSDGLIVGPVDHPAADPRSKTLRVIRLGSMSPEQVMAKVAPFISHENENWLRERATDLMSWPALMQKLRIAAPDRTLVLHCADTKGAEHELKLTSSDSTHFAQSAIESQRPRLISSVAPELLEKAQGYWGGMLEAHPGTLYLRYYESDGGKENPFGSFPQFVGAMMSLADSHSATQLIVDLRFNTGGAFDSISPLLIALKKRPHLTKGGRIRVLIENETFSAAVIYAAALKKAFGAILLGEPTGGGLSVYGDAQPLKLPHTGLIVMFPERKWSAGFMTRGPLVPDLFVRRRSYADLCSGRDPQLDVAAGLSR